MRKFSLASVLLSCLFVSCLCGALPAYADDLVKMSGAYGASSGFMMDDYIWKDANADYQEKNWRYVWGPDTVNTYDKRLFDRYQLNIETDTNTPWNAGVLLKVDPWSFVGTGNQTLYDAGTGESIQVKYKYWANTGRTINETLRGNQGNFVSLPEIKVRGGRVKQTEAYYTGVVPLVAFDMFSPNDSAEIDYMFRPIRRLWVEYKEEPLYIRFFPLSDMHEALYSDDPLRLSNNKVYWAPSPWLWNFNPGIDMPGIPAVQQAMWNWDLPWYSEDSNRNYLTFLRGMSAGYKFGDVATIDATVATPMSLWDDFDQINSVPMAVRFKMNPSDDLRIGSTYTAKYGIYKQQIAGNNQVLGADFDYDLGKDTHIYGQLAGSSLYIRQLNEEQFTTTGFAYKAGMKMAATAAEKNAFTGDVSIAQMSKDFAPGLADYKDTRVDRDWGEHIWFDPIPQEDADIRIGDSIDVNRIVLGANATASLADNLVKFFFNLRNVHRSQDFELQSMDNTPAAVGDDFTKSFIENVTRLEVEYNPLKNLQFKGMGLHKARPKTLPNLDPILRERYFDTPYLNPGVDDGMDANTMTFGGGAKVDLWDDKLTVFGIFEATNEPQDFPRRELYNPAYWMHTVNNVQCNDWVYQMYGQDMFDLPDYEFYNIWKGVVILRPVEGVTLRYTHVTNTNRNYAPLLDDNHNHDAIDITYQVFKKLTVQTGYSFSRVINLATAITSNGRERYFEPHHNFYAQAKYDINKDHNLIMQFGEFGMLQENLGIFGYEDPGMGFLNSRQGVLDTRCILRLFYQGKF